jgi:hypothetical protein
VRGVGRREETRAIMGGRDSGLHYIDEGYRIGCIDAHQC